MNELPVKKLVIVGGGTAGWMAAAAFGKMMGSQLQITLIESDEIPTVGVGEATIPPIQGFHRLLDIDEAEFMTATQATFKLGIEFQNWGFDGSQYFHSFGDTGKGFWAGDFQHIWLRGNAAGYAQTFAEYAPETQAAFAGKFSKSSKPALNYAYHFDAGLYARFLRGKAEACGVVRTEGKVIGVNLCEQTGAIQSVTLAAGETIRGDFFIDCSGFRGLLIEQSLHTGYEDWSHWLPCDTAVAMQTTLVEPAKPLTQSIAHDYGWRWRIPLQSRAGNGFVYCSRYMSDDDAKMLLQKNAAGEPLIEPRIIRFRPGKRRMAWNKNCVALGLASGFIEPLESTSIHLIMTGITRLMVMFPAQANWQPLADEYNRQFQTEMNDVRDFIILHYCVGKDEGNKFWRHCRRMTLPESLAARIDLFHKTAQLFKKQDELFRVDSWVQVMLGQGLIPESFHPVALQMPEQELQQFLKEYHAGIGRFVQSLPAQMEFIRSYCPAD